MLDCKLTLYHAFSFYLIIPLKKGCRCRCQKSTDAGKFVYFWHRHGVPGSLPRFSVMVGRAHAYIYTRMLSDLKLRTKRRRKGRMQVVDSGWKIWEYMAVFTYTGSIWYSTVQIDYYQGCNYGGQGGSTFLSQLLAFFGTVYAFVCIRRRRGKRKYKKKYAKTNRVKYFVNYQICLKSFFLEFQTNWFKKKEKYVTLFSYSVISISSWLVHYGPITEVR